MLIKGNKYLDFTRINLVVQTMADQLEKGQSLAFLDRTVVVPADDADIVTRFRGQVQAADIIADDQAAAAYSAGVFEIVANKIPNLKIGRHLSQEMLNRLNRMKDGFVMFGDEQFFRNWETRLAEEVVRGIRQRMNALIIAMQSETTTYDRYGIKLTGATWGAPSDLKATAGTDWSNTSSTPITDLQTIIQTTAPTKYGKLYDRVTMTRKCFQYVTQTTEFKQRVSGFLRYPFGTNELNTPDVNSMQKFFSDILGAQVELYDAVINEQANNGKINTVKALPNNKVIISTIGNDNDGNVMDFANGIVTESVVGALTGEQSFQPSFGPISWYEGTYNPPTVTCWGVARGFPRKHDTTATACVTAGSGANWA